MPAPIQAPTNIAAMNGPRRRRLAKKAPPLDACHALVSSDGTTISAIASLRPSATVSSASETVGRPKPTTPLTQPASRKTAPTTSRKSISNMVVGTRRRTGGTVV